MGLSFRKRNNKKNGSSVPVGDGAESVSLSTVPASVDHPSSLEWGTPVKVKHDNPENERIGDDCSAPDTSSPPSTSPPASCPNTEDETPPRSNQATSALGKDASVLSSQMETSTNSDSTANGPGWLLPGGRGAGATKGKASKNGGGVAKDNSALRKIKSIGFLTPPKRDTERVFVGQSGSSPPSVMGLFDSNIFGNENGWGGVSGFEITLSTNDERVDNNIPDGGGSSRESDGKYVGGIKSSSEHAVASAAGGGNDVGTATQSTVASTNGQGSLPRKNLTSLFESSIGYEENAEITDEGAEASGNSNTGIGRKIVSVRKSNSASSDRGISPVTENTAEKKSRSTLSRLTRRTSSKKIASKQPVSGVTTPSPTPSSPSDLMTPQQPSQPRPSGLGALQEKESSMPKVPQFINRYDDEVSKASTLTEPDISRRVRAVRARSSSSPKFGTIAEGAGSAMASGASVSDTVDKFCPSFQYDLDSAYAFLDNVLQFLPCSLPCSGGIRDAVDLELEADEKFALDFQTEIMKTGVRLIYHESPINATTDWVQSTVKLFLRPGNCHGTQVRQPTLAWAVLPVVSRMKAFDDFDTSFEVEKAWTALSLLDVHSILVDEGDDTKASSFFSITAANGVVHLFEAPSAEALDYVVKGLRSVISRLTYRMIVGDAKVIDELFSEDGGQLTGELPSLTKPCNALNKVVRSLLDQQ
ncbi:hypothetical protein ACHAW5_002505 [Stephanodiscus triporus]|uniref:Poly(ADP-ribose) glycohydrolase n=1 Tax=Stephanodiscus triporus TaxID=2934178 RepID=A0ABD3R0I7_9STRA